MNPAFWPNYEGSVQDQPNGDEVVGWGQQPFMTEFNSKGRPVFDARLRRCEFQLSRVPVHLEGHSDHQAVGGGRDQRRARRSSTPVGTVRPQVTRWQVLGDASATGLTPVTSSRKTAFETAIPLAHAESFVAVRALDTHGHVLGTSKTVKAS